MVANVAVTTSMKPLQKLPPAFAALLGIALLFPHLNYFRIPPIFDFFGEWTSAVMLSMAALLSVKVIRDQQLFNPWVAIPALGLIALIMVQVAAGYYSYPADWILWTAYLGIFLLAALIGQTMLSAGLQQEVVHRLVWTFAIIALLNFVLQLVQVFRLEDLFRGYVLPLEARSVCRPYGNIGQANHVATLVWVAIAGILYMWGIGRLKVGLAVLLLVPLIASSALTASRMSWISLGVVTSLVLFLKSFPVSAKGSRVAIAAALVASFSFAAIASAPLLQSLSEGCTTSVQRLAGQEQGVYAIRLELWRQALMVWSESPWFGSGAGSFMGRVYELQPAGVHQPLDFFPHNEGLDLLVSFGLLGFTFIAATIGVWLMMLVRYRAELTAQDALLIACLGILAGHAFLEFPLHYVQWIIPFGLWIGLLLRPHWSRLARSISLRAGMLSFAGVTLVASVWVFGDMMRLDRLLYLVDQQSSMGLEGDAGMRERVQQANREVKLFRLHADTFSHMAFQYRREDPQELAHALDRILGKGPTGAMIYRRVLLAVYQGELGEARRHLQRLLMFFPNAKAEVEDQFRKVIERYPEDFSRLAPLLDEELPKAPKPRW